MNEIVKEIHNKREKLREIDSMLEDFTNYFEKVGDKINGGSFKKMFKRITWFILGTLFGIIATIAFSVWFVEGSFAALLP